MRLINNGVYFINGETLIQVGEQGRVETLAGSGKTGQPSLDGSTLQPEQGRQNTIAYQILTKQDRKSVV